MRKPKDLCESCAKFPKECPWLEELVKRYELTGYKENVYSRLLSNPVPYCSEHEEERR